MAREKPHWGSSGVPFMNKTTRADAPALSMASCVLSSTRRGGVLWKLEVDAGVLTYGGDMVRAVEQGAQGAIGSTTGARAAVIPGAAALSPGSEETATCCRRSVYETREGQTEPCNG